MNSLIPPSTTRAMPNKAARSTYFFMILRSNFSLTTWLAIGACLQTILVLTLPKKYAVAPAALLLLVRAVDTALITFGIKPNHYLKGAIAKKYTAQVMDRDGNYPGPGQEKIAILLLSAKSNHPLGAFAPGMKELGDRLDGMNDELESDQTQESGFLGTSLFTRQDENGVSELMNLSYWRSLDDVHRFAHGPRHRETWLWWEKVFKGYGHIGIMHEVFEADKGHWEAVYANFQPTMLAATTYLKRDGKLEGGAVGDQWISPVMDASRGQLRTNMGRRGLNSMAVGADMFKNNVYADL